MLPGREHLEDVVVAHPPRRVAGARLLLAEDRERDARPRSGTSRTPAPPSGCARRTPRRSRPSTGPRARRGGRRAASSATVGTANGRPFVQSVRVVGGWPHGFADALHVPERDVELGREARVLEDEVPAQPDDLVDVLDEHRAGLDAGAAGHAVPDGVVRDRVVDDRGQHRLLVDRRRSGRTTPPRASSGSAGGRARPRPTCPGCP